MLTVKKLAQLKPGKWASDGGARGSGALWFRKSRDGKTVNLYFGYAHAGEKRKLPLPGLYDQDGVEGLTLEQCRDLVGPYRQIYKSGVTDLHGHYERERRAAEQARKSAEEAARRAAEEALRGTLRQLLDAYVKHLERQGKVSASEARGIFNLHVVERAERLIDRRAADLTVDDLVAVIGALVEEGKGRTAGKLRSYLRAAYQLAVDSKTNPDAPQTLRTFGIVANPLASTKALSKYNNARKRVLSAPEMTAFLSRVDVVEPAAQRDVLRLCLYLGGQRPTQLLRLKATDIDLDAGNITLWDSKGRRREARQHVLPLVPEAAAILRSRLKEIAGVEEDGKRTGVPVFSTDDVTQMRLETISTLIHVISEAMVTKKEAREPFQLSDIRRTAETMLAALGVSKDIRAQLQSHGLSGVQQRHYDMHEYALEKQKALKKWAAHLAKLKEGKTAEITTISAARSRKDQRDAH